MLKCTTKYIRFANTPTHACMHSLTHTRPNIPTRVRVRAHVLVGKDITTFITIFFKVNRCFFVQVRAKGYSEVHLPIKVTDGVTSVVHVTMTSQYI